MKNNYFLKYVFLILFGITTSTIFGQTETAKKKLATKEKQSIEKTTLPTESKEVKSIAFSSEAHKQLKISNIQNFIDHKLSQGESKDKLKKYYELLEIVKISKIVNPIDNK